MSENIITYMYRTIRVPGCTHRVGLQQRWTTSNIAVLFISHFTSHLRKENWSDLSPQSCVLSHVCDSEQDTRGTIVNSSVLLLLYATNHSHGRVWAAAVSYQSIGLRAVRLWRHLQQTVPSAPNCRHSSIYCLLL